MKELTEVNHVYFEDVEDMTDHAFESLQKAIFDYCLCTKLTVGPEDTKIVRDILIQFVAIEFDETYPSLIPYIEKNGKDTVVYGLIKKTE